MATPPQADGQVEKWEGVIRATPPKQTGLLVREALKRGDEIAMLAALLRVAR
jgi:hypothetical protein